MNTPSFPFPSAKPRNLKFRFEYTLTTLLLSIFILSLSFQRVLETVQQGVQANPLTGLAALLQAAPAQAQENAAVEDDLDTAMDFINSL